MHSRRAEAAFSAAAGMPCCRSRAGTAAEQVLIRLAQLCCDGPDPDQLTARLLAALENAGRPASSGP